MWAQSRPHIVLPNTVPMRSRAAPASCMWEIESFRTWARATAVPFATVSGQF